MTIEKALVTFLRADDDVAALVAARVYEDESPSDSELPLVEVSVASDDPGLDLAGNDGVFTTQIAVDCIAASAVAAGALFDVVVARLENADGDWSGLTIQHCFRTGRQSNAPLPTWAHGKAFNKRLLIEIVYEAEA